MPLHPDSPDGLHPLVKIDHTHDDKVMLWLKHVSHVMEPDEARTLGQHLIDKANNVSREVASREPKQEEPPVLPASVEPEVTEEDATE